MRLLLVSLLYLQMNIATNVYYRQYRCDADELKTDTLGYTKCGPNALIAGTFWPLYWNVRLWKHILT